MLVQCKAKCIKPQEYLIPTHIYNANNNRYEFDVKSEPAVFISYPDGTKGYKLYNLATKYFCSSNVICSERDFHDFKKDTSSKFEYISFGFDEKIDPEFDGNEVNGEKNHKKEENMRTSCPTGGGGLN